MLKLFKSLFLVLVMTASLTLGPLTPVSAASLPFGSVREALPAPDLDASLAVPLSAPVASVSLGVPGTLMIGESFSFTAAFDNTGPDVGYGPFIDVYFPVTGADGDDGIDFVSASFLGGSITTVVQTFPVGPLGGVCGATQSRVNHPYAVDNTGAFVIVCGTPGDKLVTLQLPFGSFAPDQTPAVVTLNATLSNLADVGTPLTLRARGGYQYGETPLNDWCCGDPSIVSHPQNSAVWPGSPVTPRVFNITKTYNGPEDETATGPNYPRTYTITVDVAPGQTVSNLTIIDTLPNNLAYLNPPSPVTAPGGAVLLDQPTIGAAANAPDNDLQVRWASIAGSGSNDASVTFSFFVPLIDANGNRIINAATGTAVPSDNQASASGDWTPIDGRDAPTPVTAGGVCPTGCHGLTDRSLAIQKSDAFFSDVGASGTSPGDIIEFTLRFQVSDFFAFGSLVITDIMEDGLRIDPGFTPTLQLDGNGYTSAVAGMNPSNYTIDNSQIGNDLNPLTDGSQSIILRVSDELVTRGFSNRLVGGCIDPLAGSNPPDCGTYDNGPTGGVIVFRAVVQDEFTDTYPSGDQSVDHGDVLGNTVTVRGRNLTTDAFADTGNDVTDGSQVGLVVEFGSLQKSLYAINGTICPDATVCPGGGPYEIRPGDLVTYRIQYEQPSSDFEQTVLTDYLPLPVYRVGDPDANGTAGPAWTQDPLSGAVPPTAGQWKYGPADTTHLRPGAPTPTTAINTMNNTLAFTYAEYDDPTNTSSEIDLLFTITTTSEPFTDRLFLTNQLTVEEGTTNAGSQTLNTIVQVVLTQPVLTTKKGIVASSDDPPAGDASYAPGLPGSPTFNAPGTAGLRFAPTPILSASAVGNSDISNVDADDLVTFVIVVENSGSSVLGAFDIRIRDTLMPGYIIPAGSPGLNLDVRRGDGSSVPYIDIGGGLFDAAGGIEIVDPGPGQGACEHGAVGNGRNILIITYDLQVDASFNGDTIINTGTLFNYAGSEGGPDHTETDLSDTATTNLFVAPVKSIVGTSEAHTLETGVGSTGSPRLAAIGEIVRYRIAVPVPEGTTPNFRIRDNLPTGMSFMNDSNTVSVAFISNGGTCGTNISSNTLGTGPGLCGDSPAAPTFLLDFGNAAHDQAVSTADSSSVVDYAVDNADSYGSGTDVYFKLGNITNNDRDFDNEYVVIEFNAIMRNVAANSTGSNRDNTAVYRTSTSTTDSATSNTTRVRVVQPSITFAKTILSLPAPLDAGGVVQYRITYSNGIGANVSTAFDINITDSLPSQLTLTLPPTVTLGGGAAGIADNSAGNTVDITITSVPAGGSVTVEYDATINASITPGEIVSNTSNSIWTSLPAFGTSPNPTGSVAGATGSVTGERTGSGGVNSYFAASSRNFTSDSPVITKQITATSASHTIGTDVAIGEDVTFGILLTFPEGTTPADTVFDDLVSGLEVVSGSAEIITSAADSGGLLAADFNGAMDIPIISTVAGNGGSVTFEFTNVVLPGDNDLSNNTLLMRFRVRVTNIALNQEGRVITNSATNQVGAGAPTPSNSVSITVVEPDITLGKSIILLPVPLDAGEVVHYRIVYSNGTGVNVSTAMDVHITDALAGALQLSSTGAPHLVITPSGGVGAITNNSTTTNIDITIASVPAGESVTIDFFPVIQSSITPGQVIDNVGNATWTSLSGVISGERTGAGGVDDYVTSDSESFSADSLTISKQITATSASHTSGTDVAIGEQITYAILLTFPEGSTPADTVVDDLPSGLEVVVGTEEVITSAGASGGLLPSNFGGSIGTQNISTVSGDGGSVTFEFTNVTVNADNDITNNTILLRFVARVTNIAGNQEGIILSNEATNQVGTGTPSTSNSVDATVVEPVLNLVKQVSDPTPALGQVLTFTLTISHDGSSTADAFDVVVTDDLPIQLTLNISSITVGTSGSVSLPASPAANSLGNHVEVRVDALGTGGVVTVTFEATVGGAYADSYQNDALATWTSLAGNTAGERDGSGAPLHNDYRSTDSVSFNSDRALEKTLVASNVSSTNPDEIVTIGEIVTYQIVLTIPAGVTDAAIITDTMDSGLAFVDCAEPGGPATLHDIVAGPNIISSNFTFAVDGHGHNVADCNHGTTAGLSNPLISNSGSTITFDLGTIQNLNPTSAETITLTYRVIVLDIASNVQGGVTLDNDVEWSFTAGNLMTQASPSLEIVEPDMQIEKTVDPEFAVLGSTVTFSIEISHTNDSLMTAYDVIVTDGIPSGLALVPGSVVVNGFGSLASPTPAAITEAPTQFSVYWAEFPLGETSTIVFQAAFIGPSPVFNTANVEWSSLQIDPAPRMAPQSAYNVFSTERRYDPLDLTGVNNYTVFSTIRLSTPPFLPRTGFAPGMVTELPEMPADFAYIQSDLMLEVPALNVKLNIAGVPFGEDGEWDLTWLAGNAGWLSGSAYPTHAGNSVLTAHAYLQNGLPGPFVNLAALKYGDQVIIHLGGQRYIFEVRENRRVGPGSVSVLKPEKYSWLTLITCQTYNEWAKDYLYRIAVRAVLIRID